MLPLRHILFPTDFSDRSLSVVPYVAALARKYGARVSMLHVHENVYMLPVGTGLIPIPTELPAGDAEKELNGFAVAELSGIDVTRTLLQGDAATNIVEFAQRENVDVIAMPTHGYGRFRRFLLGSVTAKVLHDAACAVLTGAHLETAATTGDVAGFNRILCSVGLQEHSKETLAFAARLANDFQAKLEVVHAMEVQDTGAALTDVGKLMDEVGATGDVFVKVGKPVDVVRDLARSVPGDLLVVGRSAEGGALRGEAYRMIQESPCPVISV